MLLKRLGKTALAVTILAVLILTAGFRPFRDEGKTLIGGSTAAVLIDSHGELYTMVRIESDGEVTMDKWLLMYHYGESTTCCLWRILPTDGRPATTLFSIQQKGQPLKLYIREGDDGPAREVLGEERAEAFAQTDWNIEDIYDDEKKTWTHTPRGRGNRSGEEVIIFESHFTDPQVRQKSYHDHRVTQISSQDRRFLQADYYDHRDTIVKTIHGSLHRPVGPPGKSQIRPMRLKIADHTDDSFTVMVISQADFEGNIPAKYFTLDSINQWDARTDQKLLELLSPVTHR